MEVCKILVVGEPEAGKSQISTSIFDCEALNELLSRAPTFTKQIAGQKTDVAMDFVLKIVNINGLKVRVQLWDMAGNKDPASVFSPLFVRNAVGCIVVGRADRSLDE